MSKKEMAVGIVVALVVMAVIFYFTNIFEIARPGIEKAVTSTEQAASNVTVKGKDVVSEVKIVSSSVQNVTSQIKIQNPLEPKK